MIDGFFTDALGDLVIQDPNAILDYEVDCSDKMADTDTITGVTWTVAAGMTLISSFIDQNKLKLWLTGGLIGTDYKVTAWISTFLGRRYVKSFRIRCQST